MSRTNTMQQEINTKQSNDLARQQRWRGWLLAVLLMSCVAAPGPVSAEGPDFVVSIPDNHKIQGCWDLLIVAIRSGFFKYCVIEQFHSGPPTLPIIFRRFLQDEMSYEEQEFYQNSANGCGRRENYLELFRAIQDTGTQLISVGDFNFAGTYQRIAALQGNVLVMIGAAHLVLDGPTTGLEDSSLDSYALHERLGGVVMVFSGLIASLERGGQTSQIFQQILNWLNNLPCHQRIDVDILQFSGAEQNLLQALIIAKQNHQQAMQNRQLAGLVAAINPLAVSLPLLRHPPSSLEVLGRIFLEMQEQRNQLAKIEAAIKPPARQPPVAGIPLFRQLPFAVPAGNNPPANPCPYGCTVPLNSHDELVEHMERVHVKKSEFLQFHPDRRKPGSGPWWAGGPPPPPPSAGGSGGLAF